VGDLAGVRVLLGVTGGIAAYKAALVARLLVHAGATVDPVLTRGAERFVGTATFEGLTGRRARSDVWEDIPGETHVALGRAADVALIYPATAHTIAKLAGGLADDLLTTTLLAATCPLVVAPAMHTEMWEHAATRANVATLRERGVRLVGPASGTLMGGDVGAGRLVEPEEALAAVVEAVGGGRPAQDLAGRRVVVTAGGTREPLDPVRYLGNRSTGKMGFAVADAARRRGAQVDLVAANAALPTPDGVTRHDVTTALELRDAVLGLLADADVVVKAAAVADFRPATVRLEAEEGRRHPRDRADPNPDVLAELGERRSGPGERPLLVGFAAETDDVEKQGWAKLSARARTCSSSTTSRARTRGSPPTPTTCSSSGRTVRGPRCRSRPRPPSPTASSTPSSPASRAEPPHRGFAPSPRPPRAHRRLARLRPPPAGPLSPPTARRRRSAHVRIHLVASHALHQRVGHRGSPGQDGRPDLGRDPGRDPDRGPRRSRGLRDAGDHRAGDGRG
jgi:phosphopantothenoylcysteine decarboxylase / phosphopantothenate---cysteine ligase